MLDLAGAPRTVGAATAAPDTAGAGTWLVLPGSPRVGTGPDVQLLRFNEGGQLTGGYLRIGFDLGVADADLAALDAALTAGNDGKPVTLTPLQIQTAQGDLVFFGPEPTTTAPAASTDPTAATLAPAAAPGPIVAQHYATALLDVNPPHHGVFAVNLTADGVRLVESGLRSGAVPIGIQCCLTAEGLWPAASVVAHVDWSSVYDHFSSEYKAGALIFGVDVAHLMQRLQQSGAVTVTAIESAAPGSSGSPGSSGGSAGQSAAISAALQFVQSALIDRFCQPLLPLDVDPAKASLGSVGDLLDLGSAYEVKDLTEIETDQADFHFEQSVVTQRVLASMTPLGNLLGGADPSSVIIDAAPDNPFFSRFHLDCHAARPLADSQLAEAIVDVSYGTSTGSLRLTPDTPSAAFDCYTDASVNHTWSATPRVTFAAASPVDPGTLVQLDPITGTGRDLAIDFSDALGLVALTVQTSTDARLAGSMLTVTASSHGAVQGTANLTLRPAAPAGTVWFRNHRAGDTLTVSGQHVLTDGRTVDIPATIADTAVFRLPDPFAGTITVLVVTDATWTDLSHLDVVVQKDTTSPTKTLSFDAPGTAAVALDQLDPTDRSYRYLVSRVVAGVQSQDPWMTSDEPILSVGVAAANQLVVDVEPVGQELPAAGLLAVQVDLLYVDAPNQVRVAHTVVIQARSDSYRWVVPLTDPAVRNYQYCITKTLLAGGTVTTGWLDSSDPILTVALTTS